MNLIKSFGQAHTKLTYKAALAFVRNRVKGMNGERCVAMRELVQHYHLHYRPRNSFTYKKEGRKSYRIREVKGGITRYYIVAGVSELRKEQKQYKEKVKHQENLIPVLNNKSVVQRKPKAKSKAVRILNKIDNFYSALVDHYYVIKNFSIEMFDEEDDQVYIMTEKAEDITHQTFVKFYLMHKEPVIPDRQDIAFWHFKKIEEYFVLMIIPKLYFRNSRVFFETYFPYGKEITVSEAKRIWVTVERTYGYEETVVMINDIEKSKASRKSFYTRYLEKRRASSRANKQELEEILTLDTEVLGSPAKPLPLIFKTKGCVVGIRDHSDRNVNSYEEIKLLNRIDRQLVKDRAEGDIKKTIRELYK